LNSIRRWWLTGSGGTQGGLVAGMLLPDGVPVIGIAVEGQP
jgi:1-aminocyclopropane-1-carboxylate deaminase/D-cysteine desulfhydrase-like pyridoxal-dependent ACC family enzyme